MRRGKRRRRGRREKEERKKIVDFRMRISDCGRRKLRRKNGANGRSDIEGKAVRVTASDSGSERVSIKKEGKRAEQRGDP